jgi:molybdenum cofactor biosynthesis protein B
VDTVAAHKAYVPERVGCRVLTFSDRRRPDEDASGALIADKLEAAGHRVLARELVSEDPALIREAFRRALAGEGVQAIVSTGGTGLSARDGTVEVLAPLLEKRIDGFGELFRQLSFAEIGPAAMLSRALAGTVRGIVVAALPGSPHAVGLAMDRLLLPELGHLVSQARRGLLDPHHPSP